MAPNSASLDCETRVGQSKAQEGATLGKDPVKLRTACDGCHAAKIRCTGGMPCARCARDNLKCHYSVKAKIGKPKGSLNKKTIERLRRMNEASGQEQQTQHAAHTPPSTASSHSMTPQLETTVIPPLPSCNGDSMLGTAPSPNAPRDTLELHSSSDLDLESPPFQDFIFPDGGLESMETWLPDLAGTCSEESPIPAINHLNSHPKPTPNPNVDCTESEVHHKSAFSTSFPCLSPPDSRKSSTRHGFTRQTSLRMGSIGSYPNITITEQSSPWGQPSCTCFSTLSNHLCTLQTVSSISDHSPNLDALLIQSQRILPSIEKLFKCQTCMGDSQVLFLVNMILSRLLKWTHASICASETRCIAAEIRLGMYHASAEIGVTVTRMLLQTFLVDFEKVVAVFDGRIGQIGYGEADGAYLSLQARNFHVELDRLAERIIRPSSI